MYRSLLTLPFYFLLIIGLTVPSDGQHGFLSVKGVSFILALVTFGAFFLRPDYKQNWVKAFCALLAALGFLSHWFLIGILSGESVLQSQFDQLKLFLVTLFFPFAAYMLLEAHYITIQSIYKTAIYATFAYVFTKVALVSMHLVGWVDLWGFLDMLGIRFMKMDILEGLDRVQTSADIAPPFLLFFVLRAELLDVHLSKKFKFAYALLTLLATFLSFSRVLLAVYAASVCLATFTLSLRAIRNYCILLTFSLLTAYLAIGPSTVHKVVERRFFSRDTTYSDDVRVRQIDALYSGFKETPFLGKGLGASAAYVRDPDSPHSYEVQWMAFLFQFGIFGFMLLMIPVVGIALFLCQPTRFHLACLGVYIIFLLAGLTNPFLISLASGILYTLFALPGTIGLIKKRSSPSPCPLPQALTRSF